jgi:hypothetical protein
LQIDDPRNKVDLRLYCKRRIQAKWLLINYLGEDHLYTRELVSALSSDPDQSCLGSYILTTKGVLEALKEDLDSGMNEDFLKNGVAHYNSIMDIATWAKKTVDCEAWVEVVEGNNFFKVLNWAVLYFPVFVCSGRTWS